jgi:hypothetical protein
MRNTNILRLSKVGNKVCQNFRPDVDKCRP